MTDIDGDKAEQLRDALGEEYLSALTGFIPPRSEHQRAHDVLRSAFPDAEIIEQSKPVRRSIRDADGAIRRLTSGRVDAWMRNAAKAHGCAQPIRLAGNTTVADRETGEIVEHFDTADLPGGVLYRPCGTRRASQCPACARTYRFDAHQLLAAGIRGGKGVSSAVASHPAVFATFTAPSFGLVHSRVVRHHACNRKTGCSCVAQPCRARRDKPLCRHGKPAWCSARHGVDDSRLGRPLCADCYDYAGHVVWNHFAGRLWSRTMDKLRRYTDHAGVKVRYAKVSEFQRRGVVHFHAIIRIDGNSKDTVTAPPPWFDTGCLVELLEQVAAKARTATPPHPDKPGGWDIRWGEQIDVQPLRRGVGDDELTEKYVRYLAKYATKSTEVVGLNVRRLTAKTVGRYATNSHVGRLIAACWRLGRKPSPEFTAQFLVVDYAITGLTDRWVCQNGHPPRRTRLHHCAACGSSKDASSPQPAPRLSGTSGHPYEKLRRWAHTVGFGGHFLTKSREYSVTFGHLRAARRNHHTPALDGLDDTTLVVLRQWSYRGSGWETSADAELARQAADSARARQPLIRAY